MRLALIIALTLSVPLVARRAAAQTPQTTGPQSEGITATYAFGEVVSIGAGGTQLVIKTSAGEIAALLDARTKYLRVPPGAESLEKAEPITHADIGVGDVVMARGRVAEDKRSVPARMVVVMSRAAITRKQEQEREEWRRRSIAGRVAALDPASKRITLLARTPEGERLIVVRAGGQVVFRRYAPDSPKFSDARESSFSALVVGDLLRVLGERGAGEQFTAEQVVSGSFRTVGGPVTAVDAAKGELTINNLTTRQPLVIVVNRNSMLRRVPAELVASLARKQTAGGATQTAPSSSGSADIQETLERLPAFGVEELKPGTLVLASVSAGADPSRAVAAVVALGLDPLFQRPAAPAGQRSTINAVGLPGGILDGIIGMP
ncbi:MAG TPA: hypothetical protein VF621_11100 [Pyrinomonadaceae bacterium]|jgi:hypothetical protein